MNIKNKISVIVPVYNVEKYLAKCVKSILNQTYQNLEVLLIDDGSTDTSGNICDEYAKLDGRVIVHHKMNGGLSDARNFGIKMATGSFIAFIDSDDYIEQDMFEILFERIRKDKSDLAICNLLYVDEIGMSIEEKNAYMPIRDEILLTSEAFSKLAASKYWYYVTAVNKLYKRELWNDLEFPKGKVHEDEFTAHYILDRCSKVSCVAKPLYMYVQREQSIMHSTFSVKRLDGAEALLERAVYAKTKDKNVAERAFNGAGERIAEGYRQREFRKKYSQVLMQLRKNYNAILQEMFFECLGWKSKIIGMLLWIHPCTYWLALNFVQFVLKVCKKVKLSISLVKILFYILKVRVCKKDGKCIFFISTPVHGNLGDQAIVYAQYQMMKNIGYEKNVVEITRPEYEGLRKILSRVVKEKDIIVIDGGGNIGTLWQAEENKMRDIIQRFPENVLFIFPQTAYFSKDKIGREELKKSIEIYNGHKKLTVFCRDKDTYNLFQEYFVKVKTYYTPDTVLYLSNVIAKPNEREGVRLCIRKDKEGLNNNIENKIRECIIKQGLSVRDVSTVIGKRVNKKTRKAELDKKWKEFSSAKLVITDRLHGMIFCAITGTPCIALDNVSHKVKNGYEWIKFLSYVEFCEDINQICEAIKNKLEKTNDPWYNRAPLMPYYEVMEELIRSELEQF